MDFSQLRTSRRPSSFCFTPALELTGLCSGSSRFSPVMLPERLGQRGQVHQARAWWSVGCENQGLSGQHLRQWGRTDGQVRLRLQRGFSWHQREGRWSMRKVMVRERGQSQVDD